MSRAAHYGAALLLAACAGQPLAEPLLPELLDTLPPAAEMLAARSFLPAYCAAEASPRAVPEAMRRIFCVEPLTREDAIAAPEPSGTAATAAFARLERTGHASGEDLIAFTSCGETWCLVRIYSRDRLAYESSSHGCPYALCYAAEFDVAEGRLIQGSFVR